MKRIFSVLALIIFSTFYSHAISSNDSLVEKKYSTSIRYNTHYIHFLDFYRYNSNLYLTTSTNLDKSTSVFGNQSASVVFYNKNNFTSHELDLLSLQISSYYTNEKIISYVDWVGTYQLNYFFLRSDKSLFRPYTGIGLLFGFLAENQEYKSKGYVGWFNKSIIGSQVNLVPGFKVEISNKMYIDFCVPINVFRASKASYINGSTRFANTYLEGFSFFTKSYFQARLGVGVNLNSLEKDIDKEKYFKTIKFNFNSAGYYFANRSSAKLDKNFPSLTLQNKKCKSFVHELDMPSINLTLSKTNSTIRTNDISVTMRYQLSYLFNTKVDILYSPYLGIGVIGGYNRYINTDDDQPTNHKLQTSIDHYDFISSGIQFYPNDKIYIDVSVPVIVFSSGTGTSSTGKAMVNGVFNALVVFKKRSSYYYFPDTGNLNVRVGIGFRL